MLAQRRKKDAENAARMKKEGETRTCARCPVCHKLFALVALVGHIVTHK